MADNYQTALKAECKKVVRCFQTYSSDIRAMHAASHRLGHQQRQAVGSFFYVHPDIPDIAFSTRKRAAEAALEGF